MIRKKAIKDMGQGSFLDIKCDQLHNPLINWFVKLYQPAKRPFVVPCRGVIPLTEESVHIMTGLPRGELDVKYYEDHKLEFKLAARLFPNYTSRPKVTDIAKIIEEYPAADETFNELSLLYIVSSLVAPTTCNQMSNKCYPMLVITTSFHFIYHIFFLLFTATTANQMSNYLSVFHFFICTGAFFLEA